jgi:glyoxylase-like metal-dependent hydrolase (beta-lactamase superfamily II)
VSDEAEFSDVVVETPLDGVDARIRRFRCAPEVDSFAIRTERWLVLVDTHSTPALARQLVGLVAGDLTGGRRLLVVDTHADYDHAWGNQVFGGPLAGQPAPILGHPRCVERLLGAEGAAALARMRRAQPGRFDEVELRPPDIAVGDGAAIHGGDLTLRLVATPGHTEDHLSIHIPELATVLAGDAAELPFPHVESAAGLVAARASLERLVALEPAVVLPCHGGTTGPSLLTRNIAWLDAVVADPALPLADALAIAGVPLEGLQPMYRGFHADACAAARALHDG